MLCAKVSKNYCHPFHAVFVKRNVEVSGVFRLTLLRNAVEPTAVITSFLHLPNFSDMCQNSLVLSQLCSLTTVHCVEQMCPTCGRSHLSYGPRLKTSDCVVVYGLVKPGLRCCVGATAVSRSKKRFPLCKCVESEDENEDYDRVFWL